MMAANGASASPLDAGRSENAPFARIVALGGGHGLSVSLRALRRIETVVTAVVGVVDDGGSSGRLREELGVIPPGDLRMALVALAGDDEWAQSWAQVAQHRFKTGGPLGGHAVGNLMLSALWEETGVVEGLERMGKLLHARGRVLPASVVPLRLAARVLGDPGAEEGESREIQGQAHIARAGGRVLDTWIEPARPEACPEAVAAIASADAVVLGPGSWYTSVLPHLQVPGIRDAISRATARRVLVLNLDSEPGETAGFAPSDYLEVWVRRFPDVPLDIVLADERATWDLDRLAAASRTIGAAVAVERLEARGPDGQPSLVHDEDLLAVALARQLAVAVSRHGNDS